ncbi:hypothetical protein KTH33_06215 [Acinetobacter johnsonii]|uniref:hypothetical protein n=1 Tax=Acinetobacter johnsonii TaxID=40214 RepID=UPI0021CDBFA3|nr:hypothetical protein [Acinetobacter johnsonii]MCU4326192.1 hypothetical protein [Acinetobacter johnsonii]
MNLIEQLGGYEVVKGFYERAVNHGFKLIEIRDALIEYRRQHNIFEIGDKVVLISMSDNEVFEYTEYSKGLDLHFFESEHNYGHAKLSDIRHATDEEIKAGKRLEVKSEN